jgi:transcription elongation GreA/GreB family factor
MDKRSLLARIVKSYPAVQSLISGESTKQDNTLAVSWESLERRQKEYQNLVQKKIPGNSKEIAVARSYGDLRENHEYKAAKEMQKLLMKRKAELESELGRARGTDFANPNTDQVSIGTRVSVTDLGSTSLENYMILGAWDSDPDQGVISYLTPVAQALLNRKVGDEIDLTTSGQSRRLRIDAIAAVPVVSRREGGQDDTVSKPAASPEADPSLESDAEGAGTAAGSGSGPSSESSVQPPQS